MLWPFLVHVNPCHVLIFGSCCCLMVNDTYIAKTAKVRDKRLYWLMQQLRTIKHWLAVHCVTADDVGQDCGGVSMSRRYSNDFNEFYHSREWRAVRLQVLERDGYLCQPCKRAGRITPAKTVDHIELLRTNWSRRLDLDNLETICRQCHNAKHIERTQTRDKKRQRQNISQRDDVITFGRNPEVY